jgi:hypothetical protein
MHFNIFSISPFSYLFVVRSPNKGSKILLDHLNSPKHTCMIINPSYDVIDGRVSEKQN